MSDPPGGRARAPWWLSAHWFCALGALGIQFPYLALFLRENVALSSGEVGAVLAIPPLIGLFAQPAWGQLADRTGSRLRVLWLLAAGTAVGYVALARASALGSVAAATVLFALFNSALVPLSTSVTFGALPSPHAFGRVRAWGTIGYLLAVVSAPRLLHARQRALGIAAVAGGPSEPGLEGLFYLAAALSAVAAACVLGLRAEPGLAQRAQRGDLRALLGNVAFVRVLLFSFGVQLFLNGPIQLFPLYVRARGGSLDDLSRMWVWMLLLEVPMIFGSGWLFRRLGVTRVMSVAAAAGGLRWLACACVPTLAYAYPLQLLHALVITGTLVGVALHVDQVVPARLRSSAQAMLVMVGSSVGGMLSTLLAGIAVDRFGVDRVFFACGLGALAWATAWWRPLARGTRQLAEVALPELS